MSPTKAVSHAAPIPYSHTEARLLEDVITYRKFLDEVQSYCIRAITLGMWIVVIALIVMGVSFLH